MAMQCAKAYIQGDKKCFSEQKLAIFAAILDFDFNQHTWEQEAHGHIPIWQYHIWYPDKQYLTSYWAVCQKLTSDLKINVTLNKRSQVKSLQKDQHVKLPSTYKMTKCAFFKHKLAILEFFPISYHGNSKPMAIFLYANNTLDTP